MPPVGWSAYIHWLRMIHWKWLRKYNRQEIKWMPVQQQGQHCCLSAKVLVRRFSKSSEGRRTVVIEPSTPKAAPATEYVVDALRLTLGFVVGRKTGLTEHTIDLGKLPLSGYLVAKVPGNSHVEPNRHEPPTACWVVRTLACF